MPSWIIHFAISNKIVKKVKINNNIYNFASIMPDILEGYHTKNTSQIIKDYSTHYPIRTSINGMDIRVPDIQGFKKRYKNELENPVILGYYSHILADYYWNTFLYKNHYEMYDKEKGLLKIKLNNSETKIFNFREIQKIKHNDLKIFSQALNYEWDIQFPTYDEQIWEYSKKIKEFNYSKDDIKNTITFINENLKKKEKPKEENYQLYSKEELLLMLENSIEFILENIANEKKRRHQED